MLLEEYITFILSLFPLLSCSLRSTVRRLPHSLTPANREFGYYSMSRLGQTIGYCILDFLFGLLVSNIHEVMGLHVEPLAAEAPSASEGQMFHGAN